MRNYFPSNPLGEKTNPFILLDYAGPRDFEPTERPRGVGEHPHRGFETVTIMYQGELAHRDSGGNAGQLGPGDVQWMTAASGVVHEELHEREFAKRGGTFEAIQLWVNLPKAHKMDPTRYQDIPSEKIPVISLPDGAGEVRLIAGNYQGTGGAAQTFTPIQVWDLILRGGHRLHQEFAEQDTLLIFVLKGGIRVGDGQEVGEAQMAIFSTEGKLLDLQIEKDSRALLMSGTAIPEPMVQRGPFVMNTLDEIIQAVEDYQSGKMGHLI